MRIPLFLFFISCYAVHGFGQGRAIILPINQAGDTTYWNKWTKLRENKSGLTPLEQSPYPFHFRISSTGSTTIEIWRQDELFHGRLIEWVKDADDGLKPFEKSYYQYYTLDSTQATTIDLLIKNSGILQLPSEENIKNWQQGLDGEEIIIQYVDDKNYHLKNYWTPSAQHNLAEALLVQQFRNKSFELANATVVWQAFEAGIPFPCFTTDNASATCRVVSATAYWQHKREVSRYVRQMRQNKK